MAKTPTAALKDVLGRAEKQLEKLRETVKVLPDKAKKDVVREITKRKRENIRAYKKLMKEVEKELKDKQSAARKAVGKAKKKAGKKASSAKKTAGRKAASALCDAKTRPSGAVRMKPTSFCAKPRRRISSLSLSAGSGCGDGATIR